MAQLVKKDHDVKTLWSKGLEAKNGQLKDSYAALLTAKDLSIVWGNDPRYWKWVPVFDPYSCSLIETAELIQVCCLQISGKYNVNNLVKGLIYQVFFIVAVNENICMNGPVTLKLSFPDGRYEEHSEDLATKIRNVWIPITVGAFTNNATRDEDIEFSLNGADGTSWKTGLTVIGAVIVPF